MTMTNVSTLTGYRNLQAFSHVLQPVGLAAEELDADSAAYDANQYRQIVLLDIDETKRDIIWIREEIRRVLAQNEMLRHQFRYMQLEEERRRAFELERRRREDEERQRWEQEMARRRIEDEDRRRAEADLRRRQEVERRNLQEERMRLEQERLRLEEEERKMLRQAKEKPPIMGRYPDPGDIITVFVLRGDELRKGGHNDPMYVKVAFNGYESLPYRTRTVYNSGEPVWDEELADMYMPLDSNYLVVTVYEDELQDSIVGVGKLDLRAEELAIQPVDIVNPAGMKQGRVYLRYSSRHPPPPPMPVPTSTTQLYLTLEIINAKDLVDTDLFGKIEPYIELHWGPTATAFFTTQVSKGCNPVYNDGVTNMMVPMGTEFVDIMAWDKDTFTKNDFLGHHALHLMPGLGGELALPLQPRAGNSADRKLAEKGYIGVVNVRVLISDRATQPVIPLPQPTAGPALPKPKPKAKPKPKPKHTEEVTSY